MIKIYTSHTVFGDRGTADLKEAVWSTKLPIRFSFNFLDMICLAIDKQTLM